MQQLIIAFPNKTSYNHNFVSSIDNDQIGNLCAVCFYRLNEEIYLRNSKTNLRHVIIFEQLLAKRLPTAIIPKSVVILYYMFKSILIELQQCKVFYFENYFCAPNVALVGLKVKICYNFKLAFAICNSLCVVTVRIY